MRRGQSRKFISYDKSYEKGVDWYISQMPPILDGQIAMEKHQAISHCCCAGTNFFRQRTTPSCLWLYGIPSNVWSAITTSFTNNMKKGVDYPSLEFSFTADGEIDVNYPPLQRSLYHITSSDGWNSSTWAKSTSWTGTALTLEPWVEMANIEDFLESPMKWDRITLLNQTKAFIVARRS